MSSPYKPKTAVSGSRSMVRKPAAYKPPSTSHSILMRKYKDDGKVQNPYIEQSTLLEPNNFIPSWEAGDEERKEVSTTLRKLRIKYDNMNKLVRERERELEELKKKLDQKSEEEYKFEDNLYRKTTVMKSTDDELSMIRDEHDFELMFQRSYAHMIERMKKDLVAIKIQANELSDSFKQKEGIMNEESEKSRKTKEQRMQAKIKLENLMKQIDLEQRKRQERIQSLQKSIRNKEEALQRRMERVRRQQEIAESAANENKDSNELKMQENFMVQRLWSSFLKRKMEKEMKRTYEIEDAFQKIRAATGFSDVQEIVHKFLTRENTYSQLLMAVSDNERKIDNLRKENDTWREKLHDLQIQADGEEKKAMMNPQINVIDQKLSKLRKQIEKNEDVNKKVQLVNDQVQSWTSKIVQKIDQQFNENISAFEGNKTLAFIFERIGVAIVKQLEQLIIEEDEEDRGYITAKDFMNDFATEEFLTKNIRVRPVSGVTRGGDMDETKTNNDYIHYPVKSMLMGGDAGEDEEKFNKMINIDMEEQRKNIKSRRDDFTRKRQMEEDKKNKKKN